MESQPVAGLFVPSEAQRHVIVQPVHKAHHRGADLPTDRW